MGSHISITQNDEHFDAQIQSNTAFFSQVNWQLTENLVTQPTKAQTLHSKVSTNSDIIKIPYAIGKWPVVIQQQRVQDLNQFINPLAEVIFTALDNRFRHDQAGFCQYLGESAITHKLMFERSDCARKDVPQGHEIIARHDFVYSQDQIKLLEVNAGCNIGGWEFDWTHQSVLQFAKQFSETNLPLKFRTTFPVLLQGIARSIKLLEKTNKTGNILLYVELSDTPQYLIQQLNMGINFAYRSMPDYVGGQVFICGDLKEVSFNDEGEVLCKGNRCDAVMLSQPIHYESIKQRFMTAYLNNLLVYPDSPLHRVAGNKMVLALLHEPEVLESLSEAQQAWVKRHIPSSTKVGVAGQDQQWMLDNKDQYVLKKSDSMQGQDVIIGRETSQPLWKEKINRIGENDDWILQQYCQSDEIYLPDDDLIPSVHTPVWGAFDGGGEYGGSSVRAVSNQSKSKVINASIGAKAYMVFEEA